MSVNLQTRLTNNTYFIVQNELYYVVACVEDHYLIEDCKAETNTWIEADMIEKLDVRPVEVCP